MVTLHNHRRHYNYANDCGDDDDDGNDQDQDQVNQQETAATQYAMPGLERCINNVTRQIAADS